MLEAFSLDLLRTLFLVEALLSGCVVLLIMLDVVPLVARLATERGTSRRD